jgi:hypothetical protein
VQPRLMTIGIIAPGGPWLIGRRGQQIPIIASAPASAYNEAEAAYRKTRAIGIRRYPLTSRSPRL